MDIKEITGLPLRTLSFGAENPENIVLFLHGLGSNAEDLISLAPIMAPQLKNTLFLSVDAPKTCDMSPTGYQWFSLQDRAPQIMLNEIKKTKPILTEYMDSIKKKYLVKSKDIALCGFSQGTMTALYTGLLYSEPFAGILGYSGALIVNDNSELTKLPILLIHGENDDVVPFSSLKTAKNLLKAKNIDIKTVSCPDLGHSIDEKGLIAGLAFLRSVL